MSARLFSFVGGETGPWRVTEMKVIVGEPLPAATRLEIASGCQPSVMTYQVQFPLLIGSRCWVF